LRSLDEKEELMQLNLRVLLSPSPVASISILRKPEYKVKKEKGQNRIGRTAKSLIYLTYKKKMTTRS